MPNGRTRLVLSRNENAIINLSLVNALPGPVADDSEFRARVGVSPEEARSLDDELSIIGAKLFGLSPNMSEEDLKRYERVMPKKPRKTGTAWDHLPKIEAESTQDGGVSYVLARGELSIFAGAIDAMLEKLAPDKSKSSRTEVWFRVGGVEIEEAEALRNKLRRMDRSVGKLA